MKTRQAELVRAQGQLYISFPYPQILSYPEKHGCVNALGFYGPPLETKKKGL